MKTAISTLILTLVFGAFNFVNAQKKQQIKVLINRQKAIPAAKLTIKFDSLLEESRCPAGANCIAAGQARISVKVSKQGGAAQTFELSTNSAGQTATFAGYQIKLIALDAGSANSNAYTATFMVSKKVNPK